MPLLKIISDYEITIILVCLKDVEAATMEATHVWFCDVKGRTAGNREVSLRRVYSHNDFLTLFPVNSAAVQPVSWGATWLISRFLSVQNQKTGFALKPTTDAACNR